MKIIAEGAEAVVYETVVGGIPALVKRRLQKKYRVTEMDTKIRSQRSKNEARIIAMVSEAGIGAPKLIIYDGYDIYMSRIEGEKLSNMINSKRGKALAFGKIGAMLGQLHNANVAHGDYTPANIIVGKEGPCVIDFGLSEVTNSVEEKALDVLLMKRSVSKSSYAGFLKAYRAASAGASEILKRLEIIERRGRYQTRTLT
jgi:Kae1-associated kinase Bud32